MINALGPFILVLVLHSPRAGGITTVEMRNEADCQAALVQLKPIYAVKGYCIAKELKDD